MTLVLLRRRRWAHLSSCLTARQPALRTDDDVGLHVQVGGRTDAAVTVVLVHGLAASGAEFDAQWSALADRVRMVRYDQRGHGSSGWGRWRAATPDRLGRDLDQVIDSLGGDGPVVVVAHSLGGMALLALADRRPELFGQRIVGVALLSTITGPLGRAGVLPARLIRTGLGRVLALAVWFAAPLAGALHPFRWGPGRRWLHRQMFGVGEPPAQIAEELHRTWVRTSSEVVAAFLPALIGYDRRNAVEVLRRLPVLVVAGTADATFPSADSRRLARDMGPRARLVLVPEAGHMVNATHPEVVNAALLDLLTSATPEDSAPFGRGHTA